MSRFTEEHIFDYLDQTLTPEQKREFEQEMNRDPEFKATVEQFRVAHLCFLNNNLETSSSQLPDRVLSEISTLSKNEYYGPSGLFSNTGFLLISGILTALVALLSMIQGGHIDLQSLAPGLAEMNIFKNWTLDALIAKRLINNSMMVIYGVLALVLLDRFVLNPFFRRKPKQLGLN